MKSYFKIKEGKLVRTTEEDAVVRVFSVSSDADKKEILEAIQIDSYDLDAALDPDEISRAEFDRQRTSIIWKKPRQVTSSLGYDFEVSSIGFFIQKDILTIIIKEGTLSFLEKVQHVNSINDVMFKYFFFSIRQYLNHLKAMKQSTQELQSKISSSMENVYFLKLFDLSESLIYYINAIEANGAVLTKLRDRAEKLGFSVRQTAFLDDVILENKQCNRQAEIYSSVLSGLMDARGNIINNNMNTLLKNLTLINVIFLPLNLIASMGGMSEFSAILNEYHISWQVGYLMFSAAMLALAWGMWEILKKYIGAGGHKD